MLEIRAHHLLCIPRFYSGGYNKDFGRHIRSICFKIRKNPQMKIKIMAEIDDICQKCPHLKDNVCKKKSNINYHILMQDNTVLKKLKIKSGSIHKAKDVFNLSIEKIDINDIKKICKGCDFLKYCVKFGINNSFKRDITRVA